MIHMNCKPVYYHSARKAPGNLKVILTIQEMLKQKYTIRMFDFVIDMQNHLFCVRLFPLHFGEFFGIFFYIKVPQGGYHGK